MSTGDNFPGPFGDPACSTAASEFLATRWMELDKHAGRACANPPGRSQSSLAVREPGYLARPAAWAGVLALEQSGKVQVVTIQQGS
jgi:hypothetical protein